MSFCRSSNRGFHLFAIDLKRHLSSINIVYTTQALSSLSFFGLKSVFVLYAIGQLSFDESQAIALYAAFMSLSYVTSLIGGTLADKLLGVKNTIVMGGLFNFFGTLCFTLPIQSLGLIGLALICLGSGFLKPNLSTAVGLFFGNPKDPQKDKAYTLYYMAINLGSFLAPLVTGFVSRTYGWSFGLLFVAATFLVAAYLFYKHVNFPKKQTAVSLTISKMLVLASSLFVLVILLYLLLNYRESFHGLMGTIAIGSLFYLGRIVLQCSLVERVEIFKAILGILLFAFFCSLYEQAGSSLILFFERCVDRQLLGSSLPASIFLSLNPLFVLILSPLLIYLSKTYADKTKLENEFLKIAKGFVLIGLSFVTLSLSAWQSSTLISPWWVIIASLIHTFGELLIVPTILATISKYAPSRFRSIMMSFWIMAIAYGHYVAGFIAQFSLGKPLETTATSLDRFGAFFFSLGLMPIGVAILLFVQVLSKREA
jgi:proton-dependent oligopeptide transporter, POT family